MDAIEAIEGRRDVGTSGSGTGYQRFETKDRLQVLLDLVRKELTRPDAGDKAQQDDMRGRPEDWGGYEFDGIRSEVDFRRAMQLEEERLRGTWIQRTLRALSVMRASLLNLRALRFLRL